jgi:tryptophan synthase alpha chain
MNHIDRAFEKLRERKETALIPFITLGDPDLSSSVDIIKQMELAGADILELGVPYSDPLADGPVIQSSSQRALRSRITVLDCIKTASEARKQGVKLPFILFTYYNPILQLGLDNAFRLLQEHDFSGIIIPDLPIEEDSHARRLAEQYNIHLIPLVAPTSNERIHQIVSQAKGFIYCVSSLGVTGVRSDFHSGIDEFLATVRRSTNLPIAIGFGISTREQFVRFSEKCDAVVIGSAIVRKIEEAGAQLGSPESKEAGLASIREFVGGFKGN